MRADLFDRKLLQDRGKRAPTLAGGRAIEVSATVTSSGKRRKHEVAQVYIEDKVASVTQPVRLLKGTGISTSIPAQFVLA